MPMMDQRFYRVDGFANLPPIRPDEWAETDRLDLFFHRPTRSVFFVSVMSDWRAAARLCLTLDEEPDNVPDLARQAIAAWWKFAPPGDGPLPF